MWEPPWARETKIKIKIEINKWLKSVEWQMQHTNEMDWSKSEKKLRQMQTGIDVSVITAKPIWTFTMANRIYYYICMLYVYQWAIGLINVLLENSIKSTNQLDVGWEPRALQIAGQTSISCLQVILCQMHLNLSNGVPICRYTHTLTLNTQIHRQQTKAIKYFCPENMALSTWKPNPIRNYSIR